jgi:hypothetical protein
MSRDDKLRAMEALWADLFKDDDRFESPVWHAQALREAERAMKNGKAKFSYWGESQEADSPQGSEARVTAGKFWLTVRGELELSNRSA